MVCVNMYTFCKFVTTKETHKQIQKQKRRNQEVTEFYMRTLAIVLQQHPYFLIAVISALLFHLTLDRARQLHQAFRLPRIRRERGIQEGHLRGIDA